MVDFDEPDLSISYPYAIRVWPPEDLMSRAAMTSWLDRHVKWDKNLNIHEAPTGLSTTEIHFIFRVQSMDDVALVKMRY